MPRYYESLDLLKMKKTLLISVFIFQSALFAQDNEVERGEKDSVQKVDQELLEIASTENEVLPIKFSDSLLLQLQDNPIAARIDSLWKKELMNSDLYNEMQAAVHNDYSEGEVIKVIPSDTLKARLAKLDAKTPLKIEYHPILENIIQVYLHRNRKSMERLMTISSYYFPMFEKELDKHQLPLELKYLAIVESALNPRARSRAGATGLWQFMYPTGKMLGLEVSSYVDERMDPVRSTEAACKYLASLNDTFDDWNLALASYNSGPGNVSKAIRRSGGSKNYWNLRPFLPRETAGYVPAFIATYYLFEYADEHGFKPMVPQTTYFETDTVHLKQMLKFEQIEKVTGVDKELLQFLNPSYKLEIIPKIEREPYALRLPKEHIGLFVNNEDIIYAAAEAEMKEKSEKLPSYLEVESRTRYTVKRGDYLGKIAMLYGVNVSNIKKWNGLNSNRLRIGQRLIIYPKKLDAVATNDNTHTSEKSYIVKNGDSLWSISRKFPGISVQNLKQWNDIRGNEIKPGMELKLSNG